MKLPAFQIQPGDLIDLEGDCFADPSGACIQFQSEYAQVVSVELEETACECDAHNRVTMAIGFEGFDIVGFPQCHLLDVRGRMPEHADDCASLDCTYDPRPCNCGAA